MAFMMLLGLATIPALLLSALMDETGRAAKFALGAWAILAISVCMTNPAIWGFVLLGLPFVLAGTGVGLGIGHAIKGAVARRRYDE